MESQHVTRGLVIRVSPLLVDFLRLLTLAEAKTKHKDQKVSDFIKGSVLDGPGMRFSSSAPAA